MLARVSAAMAAVAVVAGCSGPEQTPRTPGLEPRGTVLTTVRPTRQSLANEVSLNGTVTINPVFGVVAPADGEVRYLDRRPAKTPASRPLWVASVWGKGAPWRVEIPEGAILAGRLMDDRAEVTAGMPIVSATHAGYGIVAEIDSAQAYRISSTVKTVRAQIKNGPGPFACTPLGTIAALPAGTIPDPPPASPAPRQSGQPTPTGAADGGEGGEDGTEPTGLRLVCTAPRNVKLINGAVVTLSVVTDTAKNAMVLPVEAVAGVQGRGKVDVVGPDRTRRTVDVVLDLTDGKVVQIKSGLRGDETVAVPGPDLPTASPGEGAEGPDRGARK
jgi:hypothetical protein